MGFVYKEDFGFDAFFKQAAAEFFGEATGDAVAPA